METILDSNFYENKTQNLKSLSNPDEETEFAGFWIRFLAVIIDGAVIQAGTYVLGLFGFNELFNDVWESSLVGFLINLLYYCILESSEKQGTVGKMALGIKVVDANGNRISVLNALGRHFAKIVSAITIFIGYMMAGWDPKKQALHDKIADTYVVFKRR